MTSKKLQMEKSNMAERRSLTTVLNSPIPGVDPEIVRTFVTQREAPKPIDSRPVPRSVEGSEIGRESSSDVDSASKARAKTSSRFQPVGLIPVTVRLRPSVAGALKRASLERELSGEDVFTQQEIVERSLEPWLRHEGYLD